MLQHSRNVIHSGYSKGEPMVSAQERTTITVSHATRERLNLLKLELQAAQKRGLSQDDMVQLALACLERHKGEVDR